MNYIFTKWNIVFLFWFLIDVYTSSNHLWNSYNWVLSVLWMFGDSSCHYADFQVWSVWILKTFLFVAKTCHCDKSTTLHATLKNNSKINSWHRTLNSFLLSNREIFNDRDLINVRGFQFEIRTCVIKWYFQLVMRK